MSHVAYSDGQKAEDYMMYIALCFQVGPLICGVNISPLMFENLMQRMSVACFILWRLWSAIRCSVGTLISSCLIQALCDYRGKFAAVTPPTSSFFTPSHVSSSGLNPNYTLFERLDISNRSMPLILEPVIKCFHSELNV